jgi:xylulokinase
MRFLGLDIGASFVKGAILDVQYGRVLDVRHEPFPEFAVGLPTAHREIDPARVMSVVHAVVDPLVDRHAPDGLLCCGQMHGFVLLDRSGRAVSNCVSWQDERSNRTDQKRPIFSMMVEHVSDAERQSAGNELRPGTPVATVYAMRRFSQVSAHATAIAGIPDFAIGQLVGDKPRPHVTLAAGLGGFDVVRGEWQSDVLSRLGLADLEWPRVSFVPSVVGYYRRSGRDIPCYSPAGDQQTALLGTSLARNELSLNVGTGSQVSMRCSGPSIGNWQLRPYFDRQWLRTITHLPAGRSLNALVRLLTELKVDGREQTSDPWSYIEQAVSHTPDTDLCADLSFFETSCGSRGAFTNLHEDNMTIGSLFRAAYRQMARTYLSCARRLSSDASWSGVVLSGGVVLRSPALREEIVNAFATPCRVVSEEDETLLGLLQLARGIGSPREQI